MEFILSINCLRECSEEAFRLQKNPLPTSCWRAPLVQAL